MKTEWESDIVSIRPYRATDVPLLLEAVQESMKELHEWLPWCHPEYNVHDSAEFLATREAEWREGEHYSFVICARANGFFLGGVGINFINRVHNFANLGYWVRTCATRRGVAPAAVRLAAEFAFTELKLHRLEIITAVENSFSQRVAEKVGAVKEGLLRRRLLLYGEPRDGVLYSLVPDDLRAGTPLGRAMAERA
jgi:ribosomal-protein-serine acetyltransferase